MSQGALIRDYNHATDFEAVKALHEATEIDYSLPDISHPLWVVTKVVVVDGVVRVAGGMYIQAECYLWLDKTSWASPDEKLLAIKALENVAMEEAWLKGVDQAVMWLPPSYGRFGERLTKSLGFHKDREGWVSYSRPTKQ